MREPYKKQEKDLITIKQKDYLAQVGADRIAETWIYCCVFPPGNLVGLDVGEAKADSWFGIFSGGDSKMREKELRALVRSSIKDRSWILA